MLYLRHTDVQLFDKIMAKKNEAKSEKGEEILPTEMREESVEIYEPGDLFIPHTDDGEQGESLKKYSRKSQLGYSQDDV